MLKIISTKHIGNWMCGGIEHQLTIAYSEKKRLGKTKTSLVCITIIK